VALEEPQLRIEALELHPAQEARLEFDTRKCREAGGRLDDPREAPLGVTVVIVPCSVCLAVGDKSGQQLALRRPSPLREQSGQGHEPRYRADLSKIFRDVQRRVASDVPLDLRVQGNAKIKMQGLKITAPDPIHRRENEIPEDSERGQTIQSTAGVEQRRCRRKRFLGARQAVADPRRSTYAVGW